jgi:hypothetical protein
MNVYHSGFSASVEFFVNSRKISGAWNETVFGMSIRLFDRYCAEHYPGEALRQEMVDIWCARRKTENVNSCYTRTLVIRLFIGYLRKCGQTDVLAPPALKQNKKRRIPHAFSYEELERFFHECDRIIPWLEDGMNIIQISFLLGHASLDTTMRYLYITTDDKRKALATLEGEKEKNVTKKWKDSSGSSADFCGLKH